MTVQLAEPTSERLDRLAQKMGRSPSLLAGEAISACVERELAIIDGIERGLADAEAGRVVPHDVAMARIRATIANARKDR